MKTKLTKKELWLNLKAYQFQNMVPPHLWDQVVQAFGGDDASYKAFAHKIAGKLKWNNRFAMHAIAEYKKYVYLGVIADFSVTPPKVLDQVWHEHILFTEGYRDFCERVIGYQFEHQPELMPDVKQTSKFVAQYLDTLILYRAEFNMDPPEAFWGTAKFGKKVERAKASASRKKKVTRDDGGPVLYDDDTPLFEIFGDLGGASMGEFGGHDGGEFSGFGGGEFSGGGADGSFDSSDSGGGDSGGGDGGSGCSSGCSGCGGGD